MTSLLRRVIDGEALDLFQFTVDQYHEMIQTGILPEGAPVELLDGILVLKDRRDAGGDPMTYGSRHALAVKKTDRVLDTLVVAHRCHTRCQLPVTIPPDHEPEPDVVVVVGEMDDYAEQHPEPAQTLAVVEVADSSLRHDRGTKQRIYADANVPTYWVVDVEAGQVEVYTNPQPGSGRYAELRTHVRGETVELALSNGAAVTVAVDDVLPR
jgi:hypothetical protein